MSSKGPKRDVSMNVRFTKGEAWLVRREADRLGVTVSEFIRFKCMPDAPPSWNDGDALKAYQTQIDFFEDGQ